MLARVQSYVLHGIDALPCEVEIDCDLRDNDSKATVVGLPDIAVKESIERVRSALSNSGFAFPPGRVLINLAPAEIRKEGPLYDLPIAVGLLLAQGIISPPRIVTRPLHSNTPALAAASASDSASPPRTGRMQMPPPRTPRPSDTSSVPTDAPASLSPLPDPRTFLFAGELALDGRLRPVKGVIAMAALAKQRGARGVIVPHENVAEAAVVNGIEAVGVSSLAEVVGVLTGHLELQPHPPVDVLNLLHTAEAPIDFIDVRGQEAVKRALIVAAAGGHNCMALCPSAAHC